MRSELLRFNGAAERDPVIDAWMQERAGELGAIARQWFEAMRNCGDEVRELLHDGCPVACLGDSPFGYVNVFTSHVNVGFFHGAALPDPARLLQGSGTFMRHVKLRPGTATNDAALSRLNRCSVLGYKGARRKRLEHFLENSQTIPQPGLRGRSLPTVPVHLERFRFLLTVRSRPFYTRAMPRKVHPWFRNQPGRLYRAAQWRPRFSWSWTSAKANR